MTREEAIKKLKSQRNVTCNGCLHAVGWCESHCKFSEAIDMAIEALKQPEPCGDVVSRQAAIDALDNQIKQCCKALGSLSLSDVDTHAVKVEMASLRAHRKMLENLPTVQQEPTDEQVLDYCKKRCLYIVTSDVFQSTHLTHKVSFGDKDYVWIDGKQYISLRRFQEAVKEAQPKEGEWVQIQRCTCDAQPDLECPFCKHRIGWFDMGRYCAGCGAKLKGGAG